MGRKCAAMLIVGVAASAVAFPHAGSADASHERPVRAGGGGDRVSTSAASQSGRPGDRRAACRLPRSRAVTRSSVGLIFRQPGRKKLFGRKEHVVRYFGCLYSTGRRYFLAFAARPDLFLPTPFDFRIAGRYAAFLEVAGSDGGPQGGSVVRRDLRTGKVKRDDRPAQMPSDRSSSPFVAQSDFYQPADLVLRASGALAWIVATGEPPHACDPSPGPCRVLKADRDGRAVLDEGTAIRTTSLALHGATVSWISAGVQRSAALR